MKVTLRFDKSMQENASAYFEKSKKAKKKLGGLEKAMTQMEKKIRQAGEKVSSASRITIERKKEKKWFEKFHWFHSSDGFLVLAGRDAKSNEFLVKKHFEKGDRFFHADIVGAAHTIVKTGGKKVPETTLKEAAQFAAVYSKAWQQKIAAVDVYSAEFEQVSKQAPSGESIGTGAFMIYGKREWYRKTPLNICIGAEEKGNLICGPMSALKKSCRQFFELAPGDEKKNAIAKQIARFFEKKTGHKFSVDEINQLLPSGEMRILKLHGA